MGRLNNADRYEALGLIRMGISCRQIALQLNCHHSTIIRLQHRHQLTNSVEDRPRSGRPRVTNARQDRHVRLAHLRDRFSTAVDTARTINRPDGYPVCANTIRRRLRSSNLMARRPYRGPILTLNHRNRRKLWCRTHRRWSQHMWKAVLFTDESRFCLDRPDGRIRVWRRKGERYTSCCVKEGNRWGGANVMAWGGITETYRTPLVFIDGSLNARRYCDTILRPVVFPFLMNHDDITQFQQDNARPHSARITIDCLAEANVDVMEWPAYSPDLSPIEHLWDILKRRLEKRQQKPRNRQQLMEALQDEWQRVPQIQIQRLIRSMRRRTCACYVANGGHTRY